MFARGKRRKEHTRPFFFHRPTLLSPFSVSAPTRFSRLPARGRNKKGSRRKYFDESPDAYETFFSREFHYQRRVLLCREGVRGTEKRRKCLYLEATGPTQVRTRSARVGGYIHGIIHATYEHRSYTTLLTLANSRTTYRLLL